MSLHHLKQKIEPTILTIFGATGDLSGRFLMPALYHLHRNELLPDFFRIAGFARSALTDQAFRNKMMEFVKKHSKREFDTASWNKFAARLHYSRGDIQERGDFKKLSEKLAELEKKVPGHCASRLFYFATLPKLYEKISEQMKMSGLLIGCAEHERLIRIVIEKPFGRDLASARSLDKTLNKYFNEQQIYRIDHYLGKETVQNMLATRFANSIFEPIWNHNYIDHVQISMLENLGMEGRGAFYDETGAIRDVIQNHLLQTLALTAMESPTDLSVKAIRDERAKVIKEIRPPRKQEIKNLIALGQYKGYRKEDRVDKKSDTETFAAVKLFINNARWAGVPFYLRAGKKLKETRTDISIHFKKPPQFLFNDAEIVPNVLIFTIKPEEGIYLRMMAKKPGFGIELKTVNMELGYKESFPGEIPGAYERLLLDFMQGDQRLFARADEIENSWLFIDAIRNAAKKIKPEIYTEGSWGPKNSEKLIQKDNRKWLNSKLE